MPQKLFNSFPGLLFSLVASLLGFFLFTSCTGEQQTAEADTILFNGKIYTVDGNFSVVEAIAIKDDRIVATGTLAELAAFAEAAQEKINLEGKTVIPGLIDAHAHLFGYAANLDQMNFVGTTSAQEIADRVAQKVLELDAGEWIIGRGWDQNDWEVKEFPTKEILDAVAPDNPVFFRRIDGHAGWANSKAMELGGVTRNSKAPAGGEIIRDSRGNPTGIFIDRAIGQIAANIPETSPERLAVLLDNAVKNFLSVGLTGMHDMGGGPSDVEMIKAKIDAGTFPFRVYFNYGADLENLDELLAQGIIEYGDDQLVVRSVKAYADGALGSRGAAMIEPYSDRPDTSGLVITDASALQEVTERCLKAGFQVSTHAIGDLGNRNSLDAYEAALAATGAKDARLRIEHAQIIHPDDIPRFVELGVLPSMQPTHCTSDLPWGIDRIGDERMRAGGYVWRTLIESGAIIPSGSDFPVEDINPFWGLYSAITRQHQDGLPEGGFYPEQKMTREEALKGFTIWAAYAGFMEDIVGSLEVGKKADLIVLDRNIMEVPEIEIFSTKVLMSMVNGKFVHFAKPDPGE